MGDFVLFTVPYINHQGSMICMHFLSHHALYLAMTIRVFPFQHVLPWDGTDDLLHAWPTLDRLRYTGSLPVCVVLDPTSTQRVCVLAWTPSVSDWSSSVVDDISLPSHDIELRVRGRGEDFSLSSGVPRLAMGAEILVRRLLMTDIASLSSSSSASLLLLSRRWSSSLLNGWMFSLLQRLTLCSMNLTISESGNSLWQSTQVKRSWSGSTVGREK